MPTDKPKVFIVLGKGLLERIEDFRYSNRIPTRSQAIRRLIEVSRRTADPRMVGYLATTWCGASRLVAAFDSPEAEFQTPWIPDVVSGVKIGAALAQD